MPASDTPILDYRPGTGVIGGGGDIVPPFAAPVTSVFTRLGDIVALSGDYAAFYAPLGHTHAWADISGTPTTLAGYGITDAYTKAQSDAAYAPIAHTHTFASLTGKPTTLVGYGITDAQPLDTDLTTIAGLTATTDNFIVAVSSAWASRTPAQVRTTLGLVIGTNVEAPLTFQQSLSRATNTVNLLNDSTSPGNSMLYGTNASGIKGWYVQPGVGGAVTSVFTRTGAVVALVGDYSAFYAPLVHTHAWVDITGEPTTLAGYGITDAQPLDADLTTWAGLTPSANFQTMVPHTFAQMRTDLGLVIGTNVQAWDTDLDFWATKSQSSDLALTGAQTITVADAGTNSALNVFSLRHNTSGTPLSGFGTALLFAAQSDTTANRTLGQWTYIWTQPADATRASRLLFQTVASGAFVNNLYLFSSGGAGIGSNADPGAFSLNLASGGVYKTNGTQIGTVDLAASATNDTPAAGKIGETINSGIVSTSAVSYTSNQTKNLTSISLTAGDWDVRGIVTWIVTTFPANSTSAAAANIGTITGTLNDDGEQSYATVTSQNATTLTSSFSCPLPSRRISLSATTTVYLVGKSPTFASGTCTAFGYIEARRMR